MKAARETASYKTKSTEVVPNDKVENTDELDRPLQCHLHSKKNLNLYCSFCEKPICELCKVKAHARHSTEIKGHVALVRAAKNRRKCIQKKINTRENKVIPTIKGLILENSDSKSKLQGRIENVIQRYKHYVKIHRDKLLVQEDAWIEDLITKARKYYKIIDEKIMFLTEHLYDVEATLQLIKTELNAASHVELLLIFNALRSGFEFIHEPKWPREEVFVTMKLETIPQFGSTMFESDISTEKNCCVTFDHVITDPVVFSRIFDTRLPVPKRVFEDENAQISMTSATEMYVSFGEYIVTFPLDSRRYKKTNSNISFKCITSVRENIIGISCDHHGELFYITHNSVNTITTQKKIVKCFALVNTPSAICVTRDGQRDIFVAFHDAGKILKYDSHGDILMELIHPDPRMVYRPRHLTVNYIGDLFFSDDISNVTILDANGIWKGAISRDVKTTSPCGPLRPTGVACSFQRHVFIIDNNATTNVHIFNEDGKYLQTAIFKNLKDAYVLDIDRTGDMWVAFKDGRIRIYRPDFVQVATRS